MELILNGRPRSLDASAVRVAVEGRVPGPIKTHWVEIEGRCWPVKQVFRLAVGHGERFTSHMAIRHLRGLGFTTSPLPSEQPAAATTPAAAVSPVMPPLTSEQAVQAFTQVDAFFADTPLTTLLRGLEHGLVGGDGTRAGELLAGSGFEDGLVDSALVLRKRIGMLDTLIHAAVMAQVIPQVLEPGETITVAPCLGAGNDPGRPFDLETDRRVAEFKLSSWRGADALRQRTLFADVVGLAQDTTRRRRQMFVVDGRPVHFLKHSTADAAKKLSKGSLKVQGVAAGLQGVSVSEYVRREGIEVIDLRDHIPGLS